MATATLLAGSKGSRYVDRKELDGIEAPPAKGPRLGGNNPEDTNSQTPVWSLSIFDHDGPWGQEMCERDGVLWTEIYTKLRQYESMTWNDIYSNKKYNHSVSVEGIVKDAKDRLEGLGLDDVDTLFRFRLSGKMRIWGIRVGRVFQLLWWDPDHVIWPTKDN